MSHYPWYLVGTKEWDNYGADGFNEYGYNEQGLDRKGYKPIIIKELWPTWYAADDSYDAALNTRKEFQERFGIPWEKMLTFFFVPDHDGQRYPQYGHIVYAKDTPNIREELEYYTNSYQVISGVDTSDWCDGDYKWRCAMSS
jgi:hypothetical protein